MKKKALTPLLLAMAMLLSSCSSSNNAIDEALRAISPLGSILLLGDGLKGDIASCKISASEALEKFGEVVGGETDEYHITLDDKGRVYEIDGYDYGDFSSKTKMIWDGKKLFGAKVYDEDGELDSTIKLKKTSGNKQEIETYWADSLISTVGIEDAMKNGRIATRTVVDEDGEYTCNYSYDKKGNLISLTGSGKVKGEEPTTSKSELEAIEFDKKGNWTKRILWAVNDNGEREPVGYYTREFEYR